MIRKAFDERVNELVASASRGDNEKIIAAQLSDFGIVSHTLEPELIQDDDQLEVRVTFEGRTEWARALHKELSDWDGDVLIKRIKLRGLTTEALQREISTFRNTAGRYVKMISDIVNPTRSVAVDNVGRQLQARWHKEDREAEKARKAAQMPDVDAALQNLGLPKAKKKT